MIDQLGEDFLDCKLEAVQARPALGSFGLAFIVRGSTRARAQDRITTLREVRGWLSVVTPAGTALVDRLEHRRQVVLRNWGHQGSWSLELMTLLTRERLDAIEEARACGPLNVIVDVEGVYDSAVGPDNVSVKLERRLLAQEWLELLREMRYCESLHLSLTWSRLDDDANSPLSYLDTAHAEYLRGEHSNCIATCRKVLEHLERGRNTALSTDDRSPKKQDRKKPERLASLVSACKDITHLAHHSDDIALSAAWTREDALLVLATTTALVRHAQA